jgi:hypothetical protein
MSDYAWSRGATEPYEPLISVLDYGPPPPRPVPKMAGNFCFHCPHDENRFGPCRMQCPYRTARAARMKAMYGSDVNTPRPAKQKRSFLRKIFSSRKKAA